MQVTMAMNALSIYLTTTRQLMTGDLEDAGFWSDINRLVLYLRQSLACCVCGSLLQIPMSSTASTCQHHVCRDCVGGKMKMKPSCSWCKDHSKFIENTQLRILLQSYKSLCDYLTVIEVDSKWGHLNSGSATGVSMSFSELIKEGRSITDKFSYSETQQPSQPAASNGGLKANAKIAQKLATSKLLIKPVSSTTSCSSNIHHALQQAAPHQTGSSNSNVPIIAKPLHPQSTILNGGIQARLINVTGPMTTTTTSVALNSLQSKNVLKPSQMIATIRPANMIQSNVNPLSNTNGIQTFHIASSGTIIRPIGITTSTATQHHHELGPQVAVISPNGAFSHTLRPATILTAQQINSSPVTTSLSNQSIMTCSSMNQHSNNTTTIRIHSPPLIPIIPQQNKAFLSSSPPSSIAISSHHQFTNSSNSGKVKSKRRGCRCGLATPNPGKLTCCGQRCPCYVEGKGCLECKCRGCRNPHKRNTQMSSPLSISSSMPLSSQSSPPPPAIQSNLHVMPMDNQLKIQHNNHQISLGTCPPNSINISSINIVTSSSAPTLPLPLTSSSSLPLPMSSSIVSGAGALPLATSNPVS